MDVFRWIKLFSQKKVKCSSIIKIIKFIKLILLNNNEYLKKEELMKNGKNKRTIHERFR